MIILIAGWFFGSFYGYSKRWAHEKARWDFCGEAAGLIFSIHHSLMLMFAYTILQLRWLNEQILGSIVSARSCIAYHSCSCRSLSRGFNMFRGKQLYPSLWWRKFYFEFVLVWYISICFRKHPLCSKDWGHLKIFKLVGLFLMEMI